MKKRLFVMFTIVIGLAIFASCDTTPEVTPEATPEAYTTPTRGFWDGNTFISEYFGIRLNLPESWHIVPEPWLNYHLPNESVLPGEGARVPQYVFENMGEEAFFYDMMAVSGSSYMAIQGVMMWIEWFPGELPLSETYLLQNIAAQADDVEEWMFTIKEGSVPIGTYYWHPADSRIYDENGHPHNALMFVRADGRFSKTISINYHDIEAIDEFLNYFEAY
ncbi:MAG: hypothetical protein FWC76_08330 [Defluviitaleaceae bacterium]|nr:hypothetical protein [Defluviitaleaceae bacterium]